MAQMVTDTERFMEREKLPLGVESVQAGNEIEKPST